MAVVFSNNGKTTLAANVSSSATSISVADGSVFPSLGSGEVFFCTFDDGTNNEIVKVTAISSNTLTVVRAQESTTARAFSAGDAAELRLTAGILSLFTQTGSSIDDEIEAYLDANGLTFPDNVKAQFGSSNDLQIYHNGSTSNNNIENHTGDLYFTQYVDDRDIYFRSDNGSGGVTTYFLLDGSNAKTQFNRHLKIIDSMQIQVGTGPDMLLYHDGTHSYIDNNTGSLYISSTSSVQVEDNSGNDMITAAVGGAATLFHNGSSKLATTSTGIDVTGNVVADGDSNTFYSGGTSGSLAVGRLANQSIKIEVNDNNNIIQAFQDSDSNGNHYFDLRRDFEGTGANMFRVRKGTTTQFEIDGDGNATFTGDIDLADAKKIKIGNGDDLQIYHTGSHSYIYDTGTGNLVLKGQEVVIQSGNSTESKAIFRDDGAAELYHNDALKLATKSDGVDITGELQADTLDIDGISHLTSNNDATPVRITRGSASTDQAGVSFNAGGNTRFFGKGTDDEPYWATSANLTGGSKIVTAGNFTGILDSTYYQSGDSISVGTINATGSITSGGTFTGASSELLRRTVSGWTVETQTVLGNYYGNNIGDYIYLKVPGNSTGAHGIALVTDNAFYYGRDNRETGQITNDATSPLNESTGFKVTYDGDATFAGALEAESFSDGTISGITFIDEDSFASNSATKIPTQQSIKAYVDAQVAGVVDSAPAALDTLNELAAALGDDANFSTTTSTALGNRLRVDTASQGLTGTQQANAITNLGITATKAELNYIDGVTSNIQTQLDSKLSSFDITTQTDPKYLRSNAGDTASGTYIFSRTSTTPVFDISGHAGASSYNYFMRAGNDSGNRAVHFVNGSTRTADHGANAYVIRNDGGIFVLGKTNYATKIYGNGDLTFNDNEVWHAGNDGAGSSLDADLLDGQHGSYYLNYNNLTNKPTIPTNNNELTNGAGYITASNSAITNKLPLAGGTMTGDLILEDSELHVGNKSGDNWTRIKHAQADAYGFDFEHNNASVIVNEQGTTNQALVLGDSDNNTSYVAFGISHKQGSGSWTKKLELQGDGDLFIGTGASNQVFHDGYHPNADKWTTARTLSLSGDASGSVSWDGSANATLSVTVADDSHNHIISNIDGLQSALDAKLTSSSGLNASNLTSGTISNDRLNYPTSGDWWSGGTPLIGTDGVMEIGKYIDFHNTDTGTSDFDTRLYSSGTNQLSINSAGRILTTADEGAGNGLDADMLDGNHASYYAIKDHFRHTGFGNYTSTTTSALLTEALGDDAFDSRLSAHKTSWSYAGNGNLTDAGRLTELAGTSWLWWTDNSTDNVQGNITGLVIAPTTGGSAGKMFVYNNQGSGYSPGWREIWTSTSDGSGSGLDADLLDGQHGSHYLDYNNFTNTPTIPSLSGYATESYVTTQINNLVDSAPGTLNTLNELAAALGDDANFSTTVTNSIATKLPLAGGTMTGAVTMAGQTWNGDITWNTGKNILVGGESSIDVSGSGYFQIWDSGTGAPFIKCDVGVRTEIGQAGSRGLLVYGEMESSSLDVNGNGDISGALNVGGNLTIADQIRIGDDAWLEDYNVANSVRVKGNQNNNIGFIAFGQQTAQLGCNNTSTLSYNGNNLMDSGGNVYGSSLYVTGKKVLQLDSNSSNSERGPWNPIVTSIRNSGRRLYPDEDFRDGNNSIAVYNNSGGGTVTHHREDATTNSGGAAPNSSGKVIRINHNGGTSSPGFGGFIHTIPSEDNHTFVQIFQAKLPTGKSVVIAENAQGTNNRSYWLTDVAGTGKWEWYARVSHCGNSGTFSSGGHIYVTGGSGNFNWYLASSTVIDVTEPVMGETSFFGNIVLEGNPTTSNQDRMIDFTGYDKEGTTDFSDRAFIKHTENTGGHGGSVLLLSSQNDSGDGIAFATHGSSQLKHNSNTIWDAGNDGSGSGLDADTLDGVQLTSIMRSDTNDQFTATPSFAAGSTGTLASRSGFTDFLGYNASYGSYIGGGIGNATRYLYAGGYFFDGSTRHALWHAGNDGSGSGLDADTLDGINSGSFLRSDATDSASGTLSLNGRVNIGNSITRPSALNSDSVAQARIGGSDVYLYVASLNSTGGYKLAMQAARASDFASFTMNLQSNGGELQRGGNKVWDAGNDGSGSGLDADVLDGIQASSFLRSDAADTATGVLTLQPSANRTLILNRNISSPSNYYNDLQLEVRATSGTAGIGLHRNGYSHVGIYHDTQNQLDFDFNGGDVIMNHNAGTLWGSGNDGAGSGLDADTLDGNHASAFPTLSGSNSFTNSYNEFGNNTGAVSNDGSWNARVNISGTSHARMDLFEDANDSKLTLFTHTGQNPHIGSMSAHDVEFMRQNNTIAILKSGGLLLRDENALYFDRASDGGSDLSTKIYADDYPDGGYSSVGSKYWLALESKGGTHIIVNSDGATGSGENNYDHFTIFQDQATHAGRQFYVTNVGNVHAKGDITAFQTSNMSDIRLKKNIQPLVGSLEKIKQLQGVSFDWKDETKGSSIGFVAQDFEKVIPELIKETPDINNPEQINKSINYGNVVGLLVEAIKEQQKEIEELKQHSHKPRNLDEMEGFDSIIEEINSLRSEIKRLKGEE